MIVILKKNSQEFNSCTLNKVFTEKLFSAIVHHIFVYQIIAINEEYCCRKCPSFFLAELEVMQWYHKFSWVLYNITITTALSVTVTYWAFLSGGKFAKYFKEAGL